MSVSWHLNNVLSGLSPLWRFFNFLLTHSLTHSVAQKDRSLIQRFVSSLWTRLGFVSMDIYVSLEAALLSHQPSCDPQMVTCFIPIYTYICVPWKNTDCLERLGDSSTPALPCERCVKILKIHAKAWSSTCSVAIELKFDFELGWICKKLRAL